MSEDRNHKDIYKKLGERITTREKLSDLDLRTIFNQLIRLPEVYKQDFIDVHLTPLLAKSSKDRDEELFNHYRHYVSIPCLSSLLRVLRASKLAFEQPILQLLEHIRNLQLIPGPSTKEREEMESLQYDLIHLLQSLQSNREGYNVDLSTDAAKKKLAELYYERIMSSFISESDDDLVSEDQFVDELKVMLLKSDVVQTFASRFAKEVGGDKGAFLKELGRVLVSTIQDTYRKNYEGIFNGPREMVIASFIEAIENRCLDAVDDRHIDLDTASSSILAIVLELVFNDGFGAFRTTLTHSVHASLSEESDA